MNIEKPLPWYKNHILILMIAIPLATLIASGFTLYLAISSKKSPVLDSYKKQGLAPIKMEQALAHGTIAQILGTQILFHGTQELTTPLVMIFEHPTLANQDWQVVIKPIAPNQYELPLRAAQALTQHWYISINGDGWRVSGSTYDRQTRELKSQIILQ